MPERRLFKADISYRIKSLSAAQRGELTSRADKTPADDKANQFMALKDASQE
jgi:hypothetical protein